jgi:DNA-binding response OmpR family regulator
MLPGEDGLSICRRLAGSGPAIIMLSAMGEDTDRIVGLEIGADDYLPKTFSTRELLARLRAVLRRSILTTRASDPPVPAPVTVGALVIEPASRRAALGDVPLMLTPVEYDLLLSLARAAGRVKTREQLLLEVAERDFESFDRSIDVHISKLRAKLEENPKEPRYIKTVRGVGYVLVRE